MTISSIPTPVHCHKPPITASLVATTNIEPIVATPIVVACIIGEITFLLASIIILE